MQTPSTHTTVLLNEVVQALLNQPFGVNGTFIDGTFGRGGHSALLLSQLSSTGRLIAFDRDNSAVEVGQGWTDPRFSMVHAPFSTMNQSLNDLGISPYSIDGIMLDIGVSSPQLDEAYRGFSFNKEAPLDMRMDTINTRITAADLVNHLSEHELMLLFKTFGEEPQSARIAHAIVQSRQQSPIVTTTQLANLVEKAVKFKKYGFHPATLVFQALRIEVNQELEELKSVLNIAQTLLKPNGVLAVISFHSLEDRLVKQAFRPSPINPILRHLPRVESVHPFKEIARIKPSDIECKHNPRARSAILRVAIRT